MRVLHVQKTTGIGGSERHLLTLLPRLAEAGVELRFCALAAAGEDEFIVGLRELGIEVRTLDAGGDVRPALVRGLHAEIRAFGPDLVHTHLIHGDLYGQLAARLARVGGVSSIHSSHSFYGREPYRTLMRGTGHSARRTIAISEHVGRYVEELRLSRRGRVRVVRYGIDASGWSGNGTDRERARTELGLGADEVGIGVASRLVPHKGHEFVLEGFARAARENPSLRMLIAGDGPLREPIESRARELGAPVRFLGFVPAIREFMWGCDVMTFPSQPEFGEGFGLAALEAMAAGRPLVATAVASLPEVLGDDGAGILVDPHDPGELAGALGRIAGDAGLREAMGAAARRRAVEVFSVEAMVEGTLGVYREAL